jgi:aspartokinase/homoserine dehydrogenase 1
MLLAPSDVHSSLPFKIPNTNAIPYSEGLFFSHIKASARPNEVFVDCTSGTVGSSYYPELLEVSVPVVTPNKKGLSGTFETYRISKEIARRKRVPFLHETSVGAGLPVLSTLHDLIRSGDTLFKIEAVLSGTLSFIFNQLAGGVKFSTAVRTAKELGLTEPDPRDDLSGMDVSRKVLILAREGGLAIELEDIKATPLLPPHCSGLSAQEFMDRLEELDPLFEDIVTSARGKALRPFFSAEVNYQTQECSLGLVLLPLDHPFAALSGSDNIISFTTRRYEKQSLVVKGPGAGAEVTAAGVFADIIRIAH